jgi:EAL and modified HD-GYP domain-containing signal transduction protein
VPLESAAPSPTDTSGLQDFFIGRQSILDRQRNLAAFELLFRSNSANQAIVHDDLTATAAVVNHAFNELGIEAVLGNHRGFVNMSADMLMADMVELLPPDRVVLEVLETVDVNEALVARCRALRKRGFTIALDDFAGDEAKWLPLIGIATIVKFEVPAFEPARLEAAARQLKARGMTLLAEKVDTEAQVQACLGAGFDLFQGYFFSRPKMIGGRKLSHSEASLMRLLGLVVQDGPVGEIEQLL